MWGKENEIPSIFPSLFGGVKKQDGKFAFLCYSHNVGLRTVDLILDHRV